MDLYLIRHGRTVFNQEDRHQYTTTPLAKEGFAAAEKLATRLSDIHFDVLYSSPMLRAVQTADVLGKAWDQKVRIFDELREQKHPTSVEGKSRKDPEVMSIKSAIDEHAAEPDWHHSDEENYWNVRDRVLGVQKKLVTNHYDQTVLAVSHGVCIKMFIATIVCGEAVTPAQFIHLYYHTVTSNTGITHCRYTTDIGWHLVTMNDDAHL